MFTTEYKRLTEGRHKAFALGDFALRLLLLAFGLLAFWCGRILEGKRIAEGERNAEGKMNC
jgi:hypothetical protein